MVTGVVPSPPRFSCLQFLTRIGFSNPTARQFFIECVANSRSRAFRKSICAQEKSPHELIRVCTWRGFELTKLTYTRLEDNLIRRRGDRLIFPGVVFLDATRSLTPLQLETRFRGTKLLGFSTGRGFGALQRKASEKKWPTVTAVARVLTGLGQMSVSRSQHRSIRSWKSIAAAAVVVVVVVLALNRIIKSVAARDRLRSLWSGRIPQAKKCKTKRKQNAQRYTQQSSSVTVEASYSYTIR